jgi:hypothetical protein
MTNSMESDPPQQPGERREENVDDLRRTLMDEDLAYDVWLEECQDYLAQECGDDA